MGLFDLFRSRPKNTASVAAERLRIRRTTLVEKMRKYGMSRREEEMAED